LINEYLFLSGEYKEAIEAYKPEDITVKISNIENTPLWIVRYSASKKNSD
jgi:hypothetical protein